MRAIFPDQITPLLPALRRRAKRLSATPEEAEDLYQEAVLRMWQALKTHKTVTRPERYAMILLHNLARQGWRQRRQMEELSEDMAQTQPDAPARLACASLQAAIAKLPQEQSRLMQMVVEGETSPATIARITGQPLGTVMSRLARARKTLRLQMDLDPDAPVSDLY